MDIVCRRGFDDSQRRAAAQIYDAAFGAKLSLAIADSNARKLILAESFDPARAVIAECDGELAGLAGFDDGGGSLTGAITFALLRRRLGLPRALRAVFVLAFMQRRREQGELLMDGIAVAEQWRGKGVGGRLLDELARHAADNGFNRVRLDVINTNPAAQRLYERKGYVIASRASFRWLSRWLGFSGSATMILRLPPSFPRRRKSPRTLGGITN